VLYSYSVSRDGRMELEWLVHTTASLTEWPPHRTGQSSCWLERVHPDDRQVTVERAASLLGGNTAVNDVRLVSRDRGEYREVRLFGIPVVSAGRVISILGGVQGKGFSDIPTDAEAFLRKNALHLKNAHERVQAIQAEWHRTEGQSTKSGAPIEDSGKLARGGMAPWQERRAKEFLSADLASKNSLSGVAHVCGMSPRHFSRAFKATTGLPPHQWVVIQRVERAKALLQKEVNLSEIAQLCGFSDQSHFTRIFRAVVGTSPGAWRRMRK